MLDIGCGTADIVAFLPQGCQYQGIDVHLPYIRYARKHYPQQHFQHGNWSSAETGADTVLLLGVLHHLNDVQAQAALSHAWSLVNPGGTLLTLDGVRLPDRRQSEEFLYAIDRGSHIRTPRGYAALFPKTPALNVHQWLRLPYRHLVCTLRNT